MVKNKHQFVVSDETSKSLSFVTEGSDNYRLSITAVDLDFSDNTICELSVLANDGDVRAQFLLGVFYNKPNSYQKSYSFFLQAANRDYARAQNALGMCYEFGNGVDVNYDEAFHWYVKSADKGDPNGEFSLGCCYYFGRGTEINYDKAVKLISLSAEKGNVEAQNNLGCIYMEGSGMQKDEAKAFEWLFRAAEQGHLPAQFNLGFLYERGMQKDENKAFNWYLKAAEQGLSDAQLELGVFYLNGIGTQKNEKKAFEWSMKAAEQGNKTAQHNIGLFYRDGLGTQQDYGEANKWFLKAAEQGDLDAQNNIGLFYRDGLGVQQDYDEAYKWFLKAAEKDYVEAQFNVGVFYENGRGTLKDESKAFEWFLKAAEHDYYPAQFKLACFFTDGIGTKKNDDKAFEWLSKAAEQGFDEAEYYLGVFYFDGFGTKKNDVKAFEWFLKAAEQGHEEAQYNLGVFFMNGIGTSVDNSKAFEWFLKAAEQGCSEAENNLGYCYLNGIGTKKNESKAFEWFSKASSDSSPEMQHNLGSCYLNGIGTKKDDLKAFECFSKAAEQSYSEAQNKLGYCYLNGIGTKKDDLMAFEWFSKAAEQGLAVAQYNLGRCYDFCIGTEEDKNKAFYWYQKSADQGYSDAQTSLGMCYYDGKGTIVSKQNAFNLFIEPAKHDDKIAEYYLGILYLDDELFEENNYQESYKWIKKSANAGFSMAQAFLAGFYLDASTGIGVNKEIALEWIEKALVDENPYVDYYIGHWYLRYFKDYEKSEYYLSKSLVEKGLNKAKNWLAVICFSQNRDKEGCIWAQESANENDPLGCFILASAFYHGRGVEKNEIEGDRYYKEAIDNRLSIDYADSIALDVITEKKSIDFEKLYSDRTYLSSFLKNNPFPKTDFILAKYQQMSMSKGGESTPEGVKVVITNALNNILGARPIIMEEEIKIKKHIPSDEILMIGEKSLSEHYLDKLKTLNIEKTIEPSKYLDYYAWSARSSNNDYWNNNEYKEIKKVFDYFESNDINMDICNTDKESCLEKLRLLFPEKGARAIQNLYEKICEEHSRRNTYITSLSYDVDGNNDDDSNVDENHFYVKADKKNRFIEDTYEEKVFPDNSEDGNQFNKLRQFILGFEKTLRKGTSVEVCSIFLAKLLFPFPSNGESTGEKNEESSVYLWLDKMTKKMAIADIEEVMSGTQFFSANIHWFFEEQVKNGKAMTDEEICKRLGMLPPQFNRTCHKSLEPKLLEFWEENKDRFEE